jgi:hypothetical protein
MSVTWQETNDKQRQATHVLGTMYIPTAPLMDAHCLVDASPCSDATFCTHFIIAFGPHFVTVTKYVPHA